MTLREIADPPFTSDELTLERATPQDVPAIKAIVDAAYTKYIERIGKPPAPMTTDYQEVLHSHDVFVLRQKEDNIIVGSIVLSHQQGSDAVKINNLVVDVTAQGRGYGGVLMRYAAEFAKSRACSTLELFTNVKMWENLGLYAKMGFVETERKVDEGYERVYFRKEL